jgi:hypothetical protein
MRVRTRASHAVFALLLVPASLAAQHRSFVACPIVRDTKTVPCFLAEYYGETYYLTVQQDIGADVYPPQLLHEVLVEGTVVPGARICGGIPLKPVHLSVLPEINRACDTILPAEPGIEAPPTRRPAGPSTRQGPVTVAPPAPEKFSPPFSARAWRILYDFDSDFLFLRDTRTVTQAAEFAIAAKAKSIEITAQRAAVLLSNGRTLTEREAVAGKRADNVVELLRGLGVPAGSIKVRIVRDAAKPDGVSDAENRRLAIRVIP